MATIRNGNNSALLVIDVQNGVVDSCFDRDRIVGNISEVIQHANKMEIPIIFVQHINDQELPENSKQWKIVPELNIPSDAIRITKRFNSAFEKTDLDKILNRLEIAKLIIVGAATNWCIRATAFGALSKGYDVVLISDAHTTESIKLSEDRTIYANDIIEEQNIGIKYVEYPNIKNEVLCTKDFIEK